MENHKHNNRKKVKFCIDKLYALNYKEKPVSIREFIESPDYIGVSTGNGKGIYPVWVKALEQIFKDDSKMFVVLTGAIGIGKSFIAIIALLYVTYRIENCIDPWGFFKKAPVGKLKIVFFNLTKTLATSKGYGTAQAIMLKSPWFLKHGRVRGDKDRYVELQSVDFVLASAGSKGFGTLGEGIIGGVMDEVDSPNESMNNKIRILKAYESTVIRFESRFIIDGISLGRFFLVASKQDELSFINTYIETHKESKRQLVFDIPIYATKGSNEYCGKKFRVCLGDKFVKPYIIKSDDQLREAVAKYKIEEVPIEYIESFEMDIIGALRDISGISVTQRTKRPWLASDNFLARCWSPDPNPFTMETLEAGLFDEFNREQRLEPRIKLIDYFKSELVTLPKELPWYVHGDFARTNDAFGLAMSAVTDYTHIDIQRPDGTFEKKKMPIISTAFAIRVKALIEDEIPQFMIREFVLGLRRLGFNIRKYTSDLDLASTDTRQLLLMSGIDTEYLSVDRDRKWYDVFRQMLTEGRWRCPYHAYLDFEFKNLEVDPDTLKVDHPDTVDQIVILNDGDVSKAVIAGSKDVADGVVGSVTAVLKALEKDNPVDMDTMKKLMDRTQSHSFDNPDNIIQSLTGVSVGKIQKVQNQKAIQKYRDLLRRAR